ncbi:MAG: cobalt-precorrin 5A hydrolase [Geobacteraceae bacterium]|nr:cobalt-precorrin 5A hydrolase [Geobacteraceae bacterium]
MKIAIITITRNGARLGARLQSGFADAELYALPKYLGTAGKGAIAIEPDLGALFERLWPEVGGFICIMATGIVVRKIAPYLRGKDVDPAVVVMDDAGKFSISLLSGHLGGANELAERCAFVTGARAVITTATDANGLPSFDMLAKENGWAIEDLSRVKVLNSLLIDDEKIAVVDDTGLVRSFFHGQGRLQFHESFVAGLRSEAKGFLFVTNSIIPPQLRSESLLVLRPKNLVLGIGCNSGTSADEIEGVVISNLKRLFLSSASIALVASAEAKSREPGLIEAAERFGVPFICYPSEELNSVESPTPPSAYVMAAIGATGVAEPAALLASGRGELILKKIKSGNVTLAIAVKE